MTIVIVISKERFDVPQYRLHEKSIFGPAFVISTARRNLSFVFVSTDLTTRSLRVPSLWLKTWFEMTEWGITTTEKSSQFEYVA